IELYHQSQRHRPCSWSQSETESTRRANRRVALEVVIAQAVSIVYGQKKMYTEIRASAQRLINRPERASVRFGPVRRRHASRSEKRNRGSRRQKRLDFRQQHLNSLLEPHGQRSFRPSFSSSSLSAWTIRTPRFT